MSQCTEEKSGQKMEESDTQPTSEILPASIPASSLVIGSWVRISLFPGDLEAKFMYNERFFRWEIVEGPLRFRIQIKFSDITAIFTILMDGRSGNLFIEMKQPPLFFQMPYTNPANHTGWQQVQDFTGQATCRMHHLKFPPGALDEHYELLLQRDEWLCLLSKFPRPSANAIFSLYSGTRLMSEILPASSIIPASSLEIGSWKRISLFRGDLEAKFMYNEKLFRWEIVEGSLRFRIEIKFSDITAIFTILRVGQPGILFIEMNQPPLFFRMNHTQWQQVPDFTGQAQTFRWNNLKFPPGELDEHYELLLQSDERLRSLSQRPPFLAANHAPMIQDMRNERITRDFLSRLEEMPVRGNVDQVQSVVGAVEPSGSVTGVWSEMPTVDFHRRVVKLPVGWYVNHALSVVGVVDPSGSVAGVRRSEMPTIDFQRRLVVMPIGWYVVHYQLEVGVAEPSSSGAGARRIER